MARAGGITNAVNVGIAVQADWENREFISHLSLNVRRLFDFLVQFGKYPQTKLQIQLPILFYLPSLTRRSHSRSKIQLLFSWNLTHTEMLVGCCNV